MITKFALLFISAFFVPGLVLSQDAPEDSLESLLTERALDECFTMRFNAARLIPGLYERGQRDSIDHIITYIGKNCDTGFFRPLRNLLAIENHDDWDPCDTVFLQRLLPDYRPRWYYPYLYDWPALLTETVESPYYQFVQDLAERLANESTPGSEVELYCRYEAGSHADVLSDLRAGKYAGTCYQHAYDSTVTSLLRQRDHRRSHMAFGGGIWIPLGNNEILGRKIELGGQLGGRMGRFGLDASLFFRFLNARDSYVIRHADSLITTREFLGALIGLDCSFRLFSISDYSLEIFGGAAYDGFTAYTEDDGDDTENINAFNLSFGFKPMLYVTSDRSRYLGLLVRYNVVDYITHGGSDLSGNTLSINLVYGYYRGNHAADRLKDLHYYDQ